MCRVWFLKSTAMEHSWLLFSFRCSWRTACLICEFSWILCMTESFVRHTGLNIVNVRYLGNDVCITAQLFTIVALWWNRTNYVLFSLSSHRVGSIVLPSDKNACVSKVVLLSVSAVITHTIFHPPRGSNEGNWWEIWTDSLNVTRHGIVTYELEKQTRKYRQSGKQTVYRCMEQTHNCSVGHMT